MSVSSIYSGSGGYPVFSPPPSVSSARTGFSDHSADTYGRKPSPYIPAASTPGNTYGSSGTTYMSPQEVADYANAADTAPRSAGIEAWLKTTAAAQDVDTIDDFESDTGSAEDDEGLSFSGSSSAWRRMMSIVSSVDFWVGVGASALFPEAAPAVLSVVNAALKAGGIKGRDMLLGMTEAELSTALVKNMGSKIMDRISKWKVDELAGALIEESRRASEAKKTSSWVNTVKRCMPYSRHTPSKVSHIE